jgi:hypothetical protein
MPVMANCQIDEDFDGWIKLNRKLLKSQVFQNEGLLKVWIWCLLKAGHKEKWASVKTGKSETEVHLLPGQFIYGRNSAAKKLKMNPETLRKRMKKLSNMQNITTHSTNHYSVVTILNWDSYQNDKIKSTIDSTNRVPTEYQPSTTNKKDKNDKNKNINTIMWVLREINKLLKGKNLIKKSLTRDKEIKARLNDKFSKEDLILAFKNCLNNQWHLESGKITDLEYIFRKSKFENHLNMKPYIKQTMQDIADEYRRKKEHV